MKMSIRKKICWYSSVKCTVKSVLQFQGVNCIVCWTHGWTINMYMYIYNCVYFSLLPHYWSPWISTWQWSPLCFDKAILIMLENAFACVIGLWTPTIQEHVSNIQAQFQTASTLCQSQSLLVNRVHSKHSAKKPLSTWNNHAIHLYKCPISML